MTRSFVKNTGRRMKSKYSTTIETKKKRRYKNKVKTPPSYYRSKRRQQAMAKSYVRDRLKSLSRIGAKVSERSELMTPVGFLRFGGALFFLIGLLGILVSRLPLGAGLDLYFTNAENYVNMVIGIIAFGSSMFFHNPTQRKLTVIIGIVGLFVGLTGLFIMGQPEPNYLGVASIELIDSLLYIVIGAWALSTVWSR